MKTFAYTLIFHYLCTLKIETRISRYILRSALFH